jgi:hypothetical protein
MKEGTCGHDIWIHYDEPAWIIPGTLGAASALLSACQPFRHAPSGLLGAPGADAESDTATRVGRDRAGVR